MKKLFCLLFFLTACGNDATKTAVAVVSPIVHPSIQQIEKGVVETLGDEKYAVTIYNAQGNQSLMRSEMEEIHRKGFALVVTIGSSASHMAAEVFEKKGSQTPIVFTAVNDSSGLIGPSMTGIEESLRLEEEVESFIKEIPTLSHLLLVYNPQLSGAKADRDQLKQILEQKGIKMSVVEVFQTNEIKPKVTPALEGVDAVIILRDNTVVSGLDLLVKLCEDKGIDLLTSEIDSPERGATLGFGPHERDFGVEAARIARLILEENRSPRSIPVRSLTELHLKRGSHVLRNR